MSKKLRLKEGIVGLLVTHSTRDLSSVITPIKSREEFEFARRLEADIEDSGKHFVSIRVLSSNYDVVIDWFGYNSVEGLLSTHNIKNDHMLKYYEIYE